MSPLRARKRLRVGPFRINLTQRGLTSVSIKEGPATYNFTHRRWWVNLPGPFFWTTKARRRRWASVQRPFGVMGAHAAPGAPIVVGRGTQLTAGEDILSGQIVTIRTDGRVAPMHPSGTRQHHPLSRTRCVCGARL